MRRSSVRFFLPLLVVVQLAASTSAHATKYAGEFLKIPVGPRAIGMGGAFTAVADDATAPYWNPAGMIYLPYREVILQHSERFGSLLNHDFIGGVMPLGGPAGRQGALGLSLIRLATDDIPITLRAGQLREGVDYNDFGTDNDESTPGNGQGNHRWDPGERLLISADDLFLASSSDMAATISYARQRGTHYGYGVNLKFLRQSIPDTIPGDRVTSFGAGLDVGGVWMPNDAITVGAVVHDITTTYLAWSNGTRERIDPTLASGISFGFVPAEQHALTWVIDMNVGFENRVLDSQLNLGRVTLDFSTGLEYWYKSLLALRSGAHGKDLAFGLGVRYKHFGADYAASLHRFFASDDPYFPSDTELDITHLVSVGVSW
jgi:hypothetical protein